MKNLNIKTFLILLLFINIGFSQESKFKKLTNSLIASNNPRIDSITITKPDKSNKPQTSIGLLYSIPSNNYLFTNNPAYGLEIFGDIYKFSKKITLVTDVNFLLGTKEIISQTQNSQVLISTLIGPKIYLNKSLNFSLEFGTLYEKINPISKSNTLDFIYGPKIGFQIKRIGLNLKVITNHLLNNQKNIYSPMVSITYK